MANTDNEGPVVSESFPKEGHASNHISIGPVLTEDSSSIQDVSASKSPANPSPEPPAGEPNSSKESFTAKPTAGPNGDASSALKFLAPYSHTAAFKWYYGCASPETIQRCEYQQEVPRKELFASHELYGIVIVFTSKVGGSAGA